jgi:hypothetical protein
MSSSRARSILLAVLVVVGGVLLNAVVDQPSPSSAAAPATGALESTHAAPAELPPARLGPQDGLVPDGVTVFDDAYPAVANLDGALLAALRRAATDAAVDDVTIYVNSGWRSPAYQDQLLQEAVSKYGSVEEAARWVATADTSLHVSGDAVDVGRTAAASWLSRHGAAYGLCRTYANEPWHYELRPAAVDHGCPPRYADPTRDPRMRG